MRAAPSAGVTAGVAGPRVRAGALIAALGAVLLYALAPYVSGLLGGAALHVLCAPAHRRLASRVGARRAAVAVLAATSVLLLLPGAWLITVAVLQTPDALRAMQGSTALARVAALRIGSVDVGARVAEAGGSLIAWASQRAMHLMGSMTHATLNLVVALFVLYFMLLSADRAWRAVRGYVPFSTRSAERLRARFHSVTEAMLLGTAVTALLQGTIVGAGFALVGLPSALFWGAVTAVVSMLPVLGSAIVWLPATLVLLASGRPGAALALGLIGGVVASNIDNVVRPLVYRRISHIHPLVTLVGAFSGVRLFGIAGLLLGPLLISYFFELLRIYQQEYGRDSLST